MRNKPSIQPNQAAVVYIKNLVKEEFRLHQINHLCLNNNNNINNYKVQNYNNNNYNNNKNNNNKVENALFLEKMNYLINYKKKINIF